MVVVKKYLCNEKSCQRKWHKTPNCPSLKKNRRNTSRNSHQQLTAKIVPFPQKKAEPTITELLTHENLSQLLAKPFNPILKQVINDNETVIAVFSVDKNFRWKSERTLIKTKNGTRYDTAKRNNIAVLNEKDLSNAQQKVVSVLNHPVFQRFTPTNVKTLVVKLTLARVEHTFVV